MSMERKILLIGSLPPFRSASSALGLHIAECLSHGADITFVIDDLAPAPPADLPFPVIRQRELRTGWGTYGKRQRLYIVGDEGDSLFALELLDRIPGAVMPATLSLFQLAESAVRARGGWPDDYWHWLERTTGPSAATLYSARVHHRRESSAQKHETPAFSLLLGSATHLIAASPAADRALRASGLTPDTVLPMLPASGGSNQAQDNTSGKILYVCERGQASQRIRDNMALYPALSHGAHQSVHPAARHLADAIAEADIVVFPDQRDASASSGLFHAFAHGKCVVTAGQKWAQDLPSGCHHSIPHGEALDTLAVTLGALLTMPDVRDAAAEAGQAFFEAGQAKSLTMLLDGLVAADMPESKLPALDTAKQAVVAAPVTAAPDAPPAGISRAALIGAVPPPVVLKALMPSLELDLCPKFATPPLANRLADILHAPTASVLAHLGYEAPLVEAEGDTQSAHRKAVPFSDLIGGLKVDVGISFAFTVEGASNGDQLMQEKRIAPKLDFRIGFDERKRNTPLHGHLPESGLFWHHDPVRHCLQCILMVGVRNAPFRLKSNTADASYLVATETESATISGGTAATVVSDDLGLLEFRLMGFDSEAQIPLASTELRKQLAEAGLTLEWSVS